VHFLEDIDSSGLCEFPPIVQQNLSLLLKVLNGQLYLTVVEYRLFSYQSFTFNIYYDF